MSLIESLTRIKNAVYGREVREAIHDGVFRANQVADGADAKADKTQIRQDAVETQFNAVQRASTETTNWGGEIIVASKGRDTLGQKIDEMDSETEELKNKIDSLTVNVLTLGVLNDGSDSTVAMQNAINTYKNLYVPPGKYTWGEIELPDDTSIFLHSTARVTSTGQIKSKVKVFEKEYSHLVSGQVNRGVYTIPLSATFGVEVGDTIIINDGKWLAPADWLEHSKAENADWWKRQIATVTAVSSDSISIDEPLEFDLFANISSVIYTEMTESVSIRGGQWSIEHDQIAIDINLTRDFELLEARIKTKTAPRILTSQYSIGGKISRNKIKTHGTSALNIFYFTRGFRVNANNIVTGDAFTGDAAIQLYSYATENFVFANNLTSRGLLTSEQHMGIALHTCQNNFVNDNVVRGYMYGISSWFGAKHNVVTDNDVAYSHVCGIFIHRTWYSSFKNNIIHSSGLHERYADQRRAGIYFDDESRYIDIENNDFHHNRDDIVMLKDLSHINIVDNKSNQTIGSFLRLAKHNALQTTPFLTRSIVKGNRYRPKEGGIGSLIHAFDYHMTDSSVTDNSTTKSKYGIYGNAGFKRNLVTNNSFIDVVTSAIYLGAESILNQFYDNKFEGLAVAFEAIGQAKLNDYKDNSFHNVSTPYTFTDDFNFALDNTGLANLAPKGFKVHSIDADTLVDYRERTSTGWRQVSKHVI